MIRRLALPVAVAVSACNLAPDYQRPAAPVPPHWPTGEAYANAPGGAAAGLPWRSLFRDRELVAVIERALANNRDLRAAVANVDAVRALYRVQRADRIPTVSAGASATVGQRDLFGDAVTNRNYQLDVGLAAFELDLFGRQRNLSASAFHEYLASEAGARSARLALIAQVATSYALLAASRELLEVARETLASAERTLGVATRLNTTGLASKLDVYQAETVVAQARSDVARFITEIAQGKNALELLAGGPIPDALLPGSLVELEGAIAAAPAGLSSDVLLLRPDVLEAEHRLRGAHADIGAARAALFPRISLTAAIGVASTALRTLIDGAFWSVSPAADLPIVGSGNHDRVDAARARRDALLAAYESSIQAAFRDVADALARAGTIDEQLAAQKALVESAERSYTLAESRFRTGIDSYITTLTAQRTYYGAKQSAIGVRLEAVTNRVELYRAIGNDPSVAGDRPR